MCVAGEVGGKFVIAGGEASAVFEALEHGDYRDSALNSALMR